jgi:hypothetical protein
MAKKFYIQTQTPTIEIQVSSDKDAEGKTQSVVIGLTRYSDEEAKVKIEAIASLTEDQTKDLLSKEILYIKQATIITYDEETPNKLETIKIADTRTAKPVDPFWESSDECLAVLLDSYLNSNPWKGPFIQSYLQALYNLDLKAAASKNL